MSNDYSTRQEEELEVLRSIYLDDVVDVRLKNSRKSKSSSVDRENSAQIWKPLDVKIRLRPQESMTSHGAHAELTLRVHCGPEYPDTVPTIEVLDSNNVPANYIRNLLAELKNLANRLKDEVMILNLCQHVQEFLVPFNTPSVSIYDEMIQNKRKIQEEKEQEQKNLQAKQEEEEEKQCLELEREIRVKQEKLKEEARRRRANSIGQSDTRLSYSSDKSPEDSEASVSCKGHRAVQVRVTIGGKERILQRGRCMGHSTRGNVTFTAMDVATGDIFCLREWIFPYEDSGEGSLTAHQKSLIETVDSQFGKLCRVQHPNLVRFFGISRESQKDKTSISIVQEMLTGHAPLTLHLSKGVALDLQTLRHYCQDILSALSHLHQNDLTHGDLRVGNIFVNQKGSLKTGSFGVVKNLHELMAMLRGVNDTPYAKIGKSDAKKFDVFQFGVLTLSLAKGSKVRGEAAKVPSSLPNDFQDFLQKCLAINEPERWDVEQLVQHKFLTQKPTYRKSLQLFSHTTNDSDIGSLASSDDDSLAESSSSGRMLMSYNSLSPTSRLRTEFKILRFLGSGGFGSVIKVRNKLDSRVYAIKRIPLDPKNKHLHRRITREVMLLSRLNHENVVRYYNSWIEVAELEEEASRGPSSSNSPQGSRSLSFAPKHPGQPAASPGAVDASGEWSVSLSHVVSSMQDESSSEDNALFDLGPKSDSSIMFLHSNESFEDGEEETREESEAVKRESLVDKHQFMFIQMEFCEKQTLSNAIDGELYRETERMWRLFREIIEGLTHIHRQGMIHRDLKPVNIFLDVHDRAKIGDFGLATTTPFSKHDEEAGVKSPDFSGAPPPEKTGTVGTFLYTAPESGRDRMYTQKVDVYSLGVIFFEMSYPCRTKMERARNLANIRLAEIALPEDAEEHLSAQQIHIVRWLLQHDPLKRPSSFDLLICEHLPPPVIEEAELNDMLRHTVSNPRSKLYKRLLGSLFEQKWNFTEEYLYDDDDVRETDCSLGYSMYFSFIKERLEAIMKLHGAQNIFVPLLSPQSNVYDTEDNVSHLMDEDGCLVHLPRDTRVPFARFVARKDLPYVKRYIIDRVYRSKRVYRCHPKMFFECSFDIIAATGSDDRLQQGEVLSIVDEVLSKFAFMENPQCAPKLLINHFGLLKALLLYTGVNDEGKQERVVKVLRSSRQISKLHLQNRLADLSLSENTINWILQFCDVEDSLPAVQLLYARVLQGKTPASRAAAEAFEELDSIRIHLESIPFSRPWFVVPCLVHDFKVNVSGLLFEVVRTVSKKSKAKKCIEILCRGGRYDSLVNGFRIKAERQTQLPVYKAVGVSFSVDNFVKLAVQHDKASYVDLVLCSTGHDPLNIERFELLRSLWTSGISCTTMNPAFSVEEVSQLCRDTNVNLILLLKDTEPGMVKIRYFDKHKYSEERVPLAVVAKAVTAKLERTDKSDALVSSKESLNSFKKEDRAYTVESLIKVNLMSQEKLNAVQRKRAESHVVAVLKGVIFKCLNDKLFVEVIAVDMDITHVRNFVVNLNVESDEKAFSTSVKELVERIDSSSTKAYYGSICERIRELVFESSLCAAFVVFGRKDNSFKIVLCPANCKI